MGKPKLSVEEQELLDSVENEDWVSSALGNKSNYQKIASETLKKDTRLNIRVSSHDIKALKAKAASQGMPYQTLVSSILHKFVTGRLIERGA
jgi:predicted DNA binding CopG/RHH family protein